MAFEEALLATRFIDLYHLSLDMARYERARILRILVKTNTHKGIYYHKVAKILA